MKAIILLAVLAYATAAPQYYGLNPCFVNGNCDSDITNLNGLFNIANEMKLLEDSINTLVKTVVAEQTEEAVDGNYVITKKLYGYEDKHITVKARKGVLMVQAQNNDELSQRNYMEFRNLPTNVKTDEGTWKYENDVLTITFPLTESTVEDKDVETVNVTQEPSYSKPTDKEDMEPNNRNNENVDIEVTKNEPALTNEITDNNIYTVEATTDSMNPKQEVEFVPLRY